MPSIYDWSRTASENAHCDAIINWAEGQNPNSVNNSFRSMMQRIKEYTEDHGGVHNGFIAISDSANPTSSIRITLSCKPDKYMNGIGFKFIATGLVSIGENIGATTMAINNLPYKPVYCATPRGIRALSGGEIHIGGVYHVVYRTGGTYEGWFLLNPTILAEKPVSHHHKIPPGLIFNFGMEKIPQDWLPCDGALYSRFDYPELFAAIGTTWGRGRNDTTFMVPDLRGLFIRGASAEHPFASYESDLIARHSHKPKIGPSEFMAPRRKRSDRRLARGLFIVEEESAGNMYFNQYGYQVNPYTGRRVSNTPVPGMLFYAFDTTAHDTVIRYSLHFSKYSKNTGSLRPVLQDRYVLQRNLHLKYNYPVPTRGGRARDRFRPEPVPLPRPVVPDRTQYVLPDSQRRQFIKELQSRMQHTHHIFLKPIGGIETRPINVSVTFAIKA